MKSNHFNVIRFINSQFHLMPYFFNYSIHTFWIHYECLHISTVSCSFQTHQFFFYLQAEMHLRPKFLGILLFLQCFLNQLTFDNTSLPHIYFFSTPSPSLTIFAYKDIYFISSYFEGCSNTQSHFSIFAVLDMLSKKQTCICIFELIHVR